MSKKYIKKTYLYGILSLDKINKICYFDKIIRGSPIRIHMIEYYLVAYRSIDFLRFFKKTMYVGFGLILVIAGLISLVIPFSPGLFFIFLGITYLVRESRYLRKHESLNRVLCRIRKIVYKYKKA